MPQIFFGLCIAAKRTIFHLYLSFHIECYKLTSKLELPNHCNLDRTVCEIWAAFHMKMVWVIGKSGRQREIVSLGVGWPIAWKDNRCGVRKKHNQRDKDIRLQLRGTLKDIKQTYCITFYVVEQQPHTVDLYRGDQTDGELDRCSGERRHLVAASISIK